MLVCVIKHQFKVTDVQMIQEMFYEVVTFILRQDSAISAPIVGLKKIQRAHSWELLNAWYSNDEPQVWKWWMPYPKNMACSQAGARVVILQFGEGYRERERKNMSLFSFEASAFFSSRFHSRV